MYSVVKARFVGLLRNLLLVILPGAWRPGSWTKLAITLMKLYDCPIWLVSV